MVIQIYEPWPQPWQTQEKLCSSKTQQNLRRFLRGHSDDKTNIKIDNSIGTMKKTSLSTKWSYVASQDINEGK